jgi:hypothetical protein
LRRRKISEDDAVIRGLNVGHAAKHALVDFLRRRSLGALLPFVWAAANDCSTRDRIPAARPPGSVSAKEFRVTGWPGIGDRVCPERAIQRQQTGDIAIWA